VATSTTAIGNLKPGSRHRPQSGARLASPQKPQSIDSLAGSEEDATFDVRDDHSESPLEQVLHANRNPAYNNR